MTETFVDAAAWIALLNLRDSLHDKAKLKFHRLRNDNSRLVTTEYVLLELANTLSSPDFRGKVSVMITGLLESEDVEIIPGDSDLFLAGFDLYNSRPDKGWSLVDCASFVVMQRRKITDAFTSDRHFEQAGFTKLL